MIKRKELAAMIDHTNLKACASAKDMEKLCAEAREYGFKMVAINSCQTALCHRLLAETPVHVGAAIGFPLGQQIIAAKAFETEDALKNGADEIDYVINQTAVKDGDYGYVRHEMETIVALCHKYGAISKVIFENCYLTKQEITKVAEIARQVRPDFVKTSTGFGTSGATVEDVRLMKSVVGDAVKVKAAGGIRTLDDALKMIEAGAERIGTSHGIDLVKDLTD